MKFSRELGVFLLLVALACVRVISAASQLSQTYDEPMHVARGMRWLQEGSYPYVHHPPLAPALFAVGPTLAGVRYVDRGGKVEDGNAVLYGGTSYRRTLQLARLGNLPWLIGTCLVLWLWTRRYCGPGPALLAVAVLTNLPLVLAHSGLATTDMSITCLLTAWLWALGRYFEQKDTRWLAGMSLVGGAMLASKYSALVFAPVCGAILVAWQIADARLQPPSSRRKAESSRVAGRELGLPVLRAATGMLIALLTVWSLYGASVGSVQAASIRADRQLRFPWVGQEWNRHLMQVTVPAPEYVAGALSVMHQQDRGQSPYFWGKPRHNQSHPLFFVVLMLTKSPIAWLALALVGCRAVLDDFRDTGGRSVLALPLFVSIIAIASASSINLGLRHVLPAMPWFSVLAAYGTVHVWNWGRRAWGRAAAVLLVGWGVASTLVAHPDYLSYFNAAAVRWADWITVDSDLDWGQDVLRLEDELKRRGVESLHLAYFGTADLSRHDLPRFERLSGNRPTMGWVAISVNRLRTDRSFAWLDQHQPVATIGRSMRLYWIEPGVGNPATRYLRPASGSSGLVNPYARSTRQTRSW